MTPPRMEFDANSIIGRREEKTNNLRTRKGQLQQEFIILTVQEGKPTEIVSEWRDVPEVGNEQLDTDNLT